MASDIIIEIAEAPRAHLIYMNEDEDDRDLQTLRKALVQQKIRYTDQSHVSSGGLELSGNERLMESAIWVVIFYSENFTESASGRLLEDVSLHHTAGMRNIIFIVPASCSASFPAGLRGFSVIDIGTDNDWVCDFVTQVEEEPLATDEDIEKKRIIASIQRISANNRFLNVMFKCDSIKKHGSQKPCLCIVSAFLVLEYYFLVTYLFCWIHRCLFDNKLSSDLFIIYVSAIVINIFALRPFRAVKRIDTLIVTSYNFFIRLVFMWWLLVHCGNRAPGLLFIWVGMSATICIHYPYILYCVFVDGLWITSLGAIYRLLVTQLNYIFVCYLFLFDGFFIIVALYVAQTSVAIFFCMLVIVITFTQYDYFRLTRRIRSETVYVRKCFKPNKAIDLMLTVPVLVYMGFVPLYSLYLSNQ
ncbi:uncharacterized protein LOC124134376 [Haliotis rufescens]|uniref:uncharacterized protein LOC124134376 n=1 Tax=Haliotis rufescens TaxID=6454 RepID=UPI00201F2DD4|nr:uncharacterized protein LOC124134376 [Haliotis rufescens]